MNGLVVAIDEQSCRVRVQFPDRDNLISDWLPVGQDFCVGNKSYRLPDLDTQVVCLMDEHLEDGVVLCAIYSDVDPPPVADKNLYYRRFKDGSIIQYDRSAHKLTADIKGTIDVAATESAKVTAPQITNIASVKVGFTTPLVEMSGNLVVTGTVAASGYGAGGAAPVAGKMTASGDIKSTGGQVGDSVRNISQDRVIYNSHTHADAQGGNTAAPSGVM